MKNTSSFQLKRLAPAALLLAALAFVQPARAQFTITDVGLTPPTPNSVNDLTNIFLGYQLNDGLNYFWSNGDPNGQTFTTGSNPGGYTLTNLVIKTAGAGSGMLASQTFTLNIYSLDESGNASQMQTYSVTGKLNAEGDWLVWSGLGVSLLPNTNYAYTFAGSAGYEQLSNNGQDPYAGGEICQIPSGGGAVVYGSTRVSDAAFNLGLALGTVAGGTVAVTDIGIFPPTPGPNDISQLVGDAQNTYGMNYYWDSNPGQTFTTPSSSVPWIMNRLALKFAGGGGNSQFSPQNFIVRLYSVTNGTTASLIYSNSPVYPAALASDNGEWFDCTGMSVVLQPNTQYAWTFNRGVGSSSWELLATRDGNPYAGGKICLIPAAGGAITYGSQGSGNTNADAGFIVGLESPCVYAMLPGVIPNVATIYAGTPVTLNEAGIGSGTLSYQWQTDGGSGTFTNIPGATSSNLVVDTTSLVGTYSYQVIVHTTDCGGADSTSAPVALNITSASAPFIITDTTATPNATTNYEGNSQSFSVVMDGTAPIAYQWYKATDAGGTGTTPVLNATNATLTFNNLALGDTGFYSVLATNKVDPYSATSTWVELTVLPVSAMLIHWQTPVAFNGHSAEQILTNPITAGGGILGAAHFGSGTNIPVVINGWTNVFYSDGSKVSITGQAGKTTGAYPAGGSMTTGNTNFDSVLNQFAYDGGSHTITLHNLMVGSNYFVQVFALDDRGPGLSRYTSFQDPSQSADVSATYGMFENKYLVGTFTAPSTDLAIRQNLLPSGQGNINAAVVGTVGWVPAFPPRFLTQPASFVVTAGATVQFTTAVDAQPAATTRWQISTDAGSTFNNLNDGSFGGATISGATSNVLTMANVTLASNGWMVRNTAINSFGSALSSQATLSVITPKGHPEYWNIYGAGIWDTDTLNWTADSAGSSGATGWTNGNDAIFSADTGSPAQFNVTVTNTGVGVNNLAQRLGQIRLMTGPISVLNTACVVTVASRVASGDYDLRIDSVLSGSAEIKKEGPGILLLTGNNTFSGGLTLNDGTVSVETSTTAFGTGTLTLNGGYLTKSYGNGSPISWTNRVNVMGPVCVETVQGGGTRLHLDGPWSAGSTNGNFIVPNTNINNLAVQGYAVVVGGDVSAYTGTFTHNALASGGQRLRFGKGLGSSAGINAAKAKFFLTGSTGAGAPMDLMDNDYGPFKMGELAGTGGTLRAGVSSGGDTIFEVGYLNTSSTFDGRIIQQLSGSNGRAHLTKVGTGTLTMTANSAYTGLTTVSNGTLKINLPFLSSATNVVIESAGKLELNFTGTNVVNALYVAGAAKAPGTYGSSSSPAVNVDNVHFAGTGMLSVTTGPVPPAPAKLTNSVSGSLLTLSWPAGQGWSLQWQTNSISKGLGTNWVTLVPGSSGISSTNISMNSTNPTVFYRLVWP